MFLDFPANTETAHIIESKYLYSIKARLASQLSGFNLLVGSQIPEIPTVTSNLDEAVTVRVLDPTQYT